VTKYVLDLLKEYPAQNLLLAGIIILVTGCSQIATSTPQPGAVNRETASLPTSAPTFEPTPTNTRVVPIENLTPAPPATITPIPDDTQGLVVEVIDGQTIAVVMQGDPPSRVYLVRYLGIDTSSPEDPWGAVAYEANRKMAGFKVVRLVRDQSDVDDEGRLLRYVYVGNELLSIILTEQGLARADITEPDTRFEAEILDAEARARTGQLGLWSGSAPTPTPSSPPDSESAEGTVEPVELTPEATIATTVEPATTAETPTPETSTNDSTTTPTATIEPTSESTSEDTP
jgi:endonuclease YncB( thermonuclease family)